MKIQDLKQGTKFVVDGRTYMKLPKHAECYGNPSNAIDMITGTMIYFNENKIVSVEDGDNEYEK